MSASTVAAVGALVDTYRVLTPVLAEHLEDNNGELLPHLVMADIVRWLVAHVETELDLCRAVVAWLESEYERGPEDIRGLIAVSGVEMIPDPGLPGSELRDMLGPVLARLDPWLA